MAADYGHALTPQSAVTATGISPLGRHLNGSSSVDRFLLAGVCLCWKRLAPSRPAGVAGAHAYARYLLTRLRRELADRLGPRGCSI